MVREPDTTYFITGGAGFIGSNLADRLLDEGHRVVVYDDFSTGQREFLASASARDGFELIEGDLLDADALTRAMSGSDFVFHLAANADIRFGLAHPRRDLEPERHYRPALHVRARGGGSWLRAPDLAGTAAHAGQQRRGGDWGGSEASHIPR